MSWKEFDMKAALLSQIVELKEAFREYDKISMQPLATEMKFAILLRCINAPWKSIESKVVREKTRERKAK